MNNFAGGQLKHKKPKIEAARIKQKEDSLFPAKRYRIPTVVIVVKDSDPQSPSRPSIRLNALITPIIQQNVKI